MASLPNKHRKRANNAPHFFKIILDHHIHDGKLGIPRKFVKNYGNNLSTPVFLKVCDGTVWEVELAKCDGEIWLQKGWQEFVNHYSLTRGHFLVFEYHQRVSSHFNVLIFDKSASEIDYPSRHNNINGDNEHNLEEEFQEPKIKKESTESDSDPEILEDILSSQKPQKIMKVEKGKRSHGSIRYRQDRTSDSGGFSVKKKRLNSKAKTRALHMASANFKSRNPFFMVAMQPSYVSSKDRVSIPASFAMIYFKQKQGDAILSTSARRTWGVKYFIYDNVKIYKQASARLACGWRAFAEDNELKLGDVCVFELIKGVKTTFNVAIFRCEKTFNK